jgi:NAD(P)-dependent dehydrogenase (short-subunit alcohol dehydrogenase family)
MSAEQKIAVVTGANRGIGFEVCRELAQKGNRVVLTSRSEEKGKAACKQLRSEDLDVEYHQLDVTDDQSVKDFSDWLNGEFGHCDILVNNAGIFPDSKDASGADWPSIFDTSIEVMRRAMDTNVYGAMRISQALVPLMKKNNYGRIVNLSSGMGQLSDMNGHCPAYRISKTAINALTRIVADEVKECNILVNSMCPGWVKTDMGGPGATRELPEGADTAVWLATLPNDGPRGKFFRDRKEIEW